MYRSPIACYGAKDVSSIGNTMACPRWQNLSFSSTDKTLSRRGGTREKQKAFVKLLIRFVTGMGANRL